MSDQAFDLAVARYLEEMGMATAEQISGAMRVQLDLAAKGRPVPLTEALVQTGILTPVLRENIEKTVRERRAGPGQFSQYKLLDKLGEGGMGEVYLAEDTEAKRKVAIKVLPRKYADDPDFVARFRREAEAASKLRHENIVGAYATGLEFGYCFYVMEYCDGEPLDKRLRRERVLPWAVAVRIVAQAARGLQYAHANGFIHRDIKPANILVTRGGVAKILDLGLSRKIAGHGGSFTTASGAVMGTPHYIAPEQANAGKVDARADLYSLGATLYHLVTGSTPFTGTTPIEILYKQVHAQLPNPQDINEDLPDTLVHVLRKMMAKDPADRYPDAEGCILDLEEVMAGRTPTTNVLEPAKSAVALVRTRPARKRTTIRAAATPPSRAPLAAGAGLAAVVVVIVLLLLNRGPAPEGPAPTVALPTPAVRAPDPPRPSDPPIPAESLEPWRNGIDLLPLVNPAEDAVAGAWSRQDGGLRVDASLRARLQIPYVPSQQYDVRVVFTRVDGDDCTSVLLTLGGQPFVCHLGAGGNTAFAFDRVQFQPLETNPSARRESRCLETGRRYEARIQVRLNTVVAFLDGRPVARWTSNLKDLSRDPAWALRDETLLGLGASGTATIFHSVELREVFGRGRPTREAGAVSFADLPWRPIFDGRSMDGLGVIRGKWNVEEGALCSSSDGSAFLTRREFGDADLRIRFEARKTTYLELAMRHNVGKGSCMTALDRPQLEPLQSKVRTVEFRCRGASVEASLDGEPMVFRERSSALSGSFVVYVRGEAFRILSLEVRESALASQGWRTLFDGKSLDGVAANVLESWRIRDGALEPVAPGAFLLATRDHLGDGESRIVFEARRLSYLMVDVRWTIGGKYRASIDRTVTSGLERRKVELIIRSRGDLVAATLDGRPLEFSSTSRTASGTLRLQGDAESFRLYSIEHRPIP